MTSSASYVYSVYSLLAKNTFSTETHRKSLRVTERFLKVVFLYYFKKFDNQASQAYSQAIQVEFGESRAGALVITLTQLTQPFLVWHVPSGRAK